ncbi:alpha-N-acetylglucosaminidase [Niabella aquatica]
MITGYFNGWACNTKPFVQPAKDLIRRVIGVEADQFIVEGMTAKNGKDHFEIDKKGQKVLLRGTSGIAIASAFNHYLKYVAHCQVTWNGSNLNLPAKLPLPQFKIVKKTPYDYRYYLNYCTYNYSMSWWDWERWEQEIDWMAMNGINMPLSVLGLNEVLYQLYTGMGMKEADLENFFSGPAYFAWFWMGNLDGWGGPLPRSLMLKHAALQKKILQRQRALGMKPVLPAFSGHVPPAFKKYFPKANIKSVGWNGIFPNINIIDPGDSLFVTTGRRFMEIQTGLFGTDHLYSADTFNEVDPPTDDPAFISGVSRNVYQSMATADSDAVWIMQGWLFYFSRKFWKEPQVKALLNAVPDDKMIILDLWTEKFPVWSKNGSYYGKPWIWNMLNNFGGNNVVHGLMDSIANNPSRDLKNPHAGKMAGIGLTMEAIETNPVVYEMMMENTWRTDPIDITAWLKQYTLRRYGKANAHANNAWNILRHTAYADSLTSRGPRSMIQSRPTFSSKGIRIDLRFPYDNKELARAWNELLLAAPALSLSDGFRFDLVDVTRQVLSNHAISIHKKFTEAYSKKDMVAYQKYTADFIVLIEDMDRLVASRKEFLLGRWIADARRLGNTEEEKDLYERNARNLITTWGDKDNRLHEYSARQWSGLFNSFYKPRWQQFFRATMYSLEHNKSFDADSFIKEIRNWEWSWIKNKQVFNTEPTGDPIALCTEMYTKYSRFIETYVLNYENNAIIP